MKWINEKTVQGDPMDTKNYFIPKEEYNIPTVNEGIQEGRKLVFCKDCKRWFYFIESEKHHCTESDKPLWDCPIREEDDFCSRGERAE